MLVVQLAGMPSQCRQKGNEDNLKSPKKIQEIQANQNQNKAANTPILAPKPFFSLSKVARCIFFASSVKNKNTWNDRSKQTLTWSAWSLKSGIEMNGQMVAKKAKKKPAAKGGHHASKKVTAKKESINDDSDQENENNEGIGHLKSTHITYHIQHT